MRPAEKFVEVVRKLRSLSFTSNFEQAADEIVTAAHCVGSGGGETGEGVVFNYGMLHMRIQMA